MRNVVVYERAGSFAGWPANNGLWSWDGEEILIGLTAGAFEEKSGHNINEPYRSVLARSMDQGDTWSPVEPENFVGRGTDVRELPDRIDCTGRGTALRVVGTAYHGSSSPGGAFYASQDRGDTWRGPFFFGSLMEHEQLRGLEFTSRTDYIVDGPDDCLFMMSARGPRQPMDRVFCARTGDGGTNFDFVSWVVPPSDPYRAVMPSTVRCRSGRLVSAIRRMDPDTDRCWIDAYASEDNGNSWAPLAEVGDAGPWNGNPPALARLDDGRLCCAFGNRETCRIIVKFSMDEGRTWSGEAVLRSDFQRDSYDDPDLGYPRLTQRSDGKMLAVYYWATRERPHHHIVATIWEP